MRRALVWLNLYGREAVQRKLKNRPKVHFFVFFTVGHLCPSIVLISHCDELFFEPFFIHVYNVYCCWIPDTFLDQNIIQFM